MTIINPADKIKIFLIHCGEWVKMHATEKKSGHPCIAYIFLNDNSLRDAYLIITRDGDLKNAQTIETNKCCFIPINDQIILQYNENHILFTFKNHRNHSILLSRDNAQDTNRKCEIFSSQFTICQISSPSVEEEKYYDSNDEFIVLHAIDPQVISEMKFYDASKIPTAVFPTVEDKNTIEILTRRNRRLNLYDFTNNVEIDVCCVTWNVGEGSPKSDPTVLQDLTTIAQENHDIYFFVFEETDMSISSVVSNKNKKVHKWEKMLKKAFNIKRKLIFGQRKPIKGESTHEYSLYQAVSEGGVASAIVVKNELPVNLEFDKPKKIRLGFHGMTANKSALIFPTIIGDYSLIYFIGCHLTAHQENVNERNKQLLSLLEKNLMDDLDDLDEDELVEESGSSSSTSSSSFSSSDEVNQVAKYKTDDQDFFFRLSQLVEFIVLIGDLNYRIDMSRQECLKCIQAGDFDKLLAKDQLNMAKIEEPRLQAFEEGKIAFNPTYKYDKGTDVYDTSPKQRVPSFTDRVLVVTNDRKIGQRDHEKRESPQTDDENGNFVCEIDIVKKQFAEQFGITQGNWTNKYPSQNAKKPEVQSYTRIENHFSDHVPVKCVMKFFIPKVVPELYQKFQQFQLQKLKEIEDFAVPYLVSDKSSIHVSYSQEGTIILKNTSFAWAHWSAVFENSNQKLLKDCNDIDISISPVKGVIFPNQTETLTITKISSNSQERIKRIHIISNNNTEFLSIDLN